MTASLLDTARVPRNEITHDEHVRYSALLEELKRKNPPGEPGSTAHSNLEWSLFDMRFADPDTVEKFLRKKHIEKNITPEEEIAFSEKIHEQTIQRLIPGMARDLLQLQERITNALITKASGAALPSIGEVIDVEASTEAKNLKKALEESLPLRDDNRAYRILLSHVEGVAWSNAAAQYTKHTESAAAVATAPAGMENSDLARLLALKKQIDEKLEGGAVSTLRYAGEGRNENGLDIPVKAIGEEASGLLNVDTTALDILRGQQVETYHHR